MATWIRSAYHNVGRGTGGNGRPWKPAVVNGVTVEPQRNNWSCGPAALRYCLLVHGIDEDVTRLAHLAGSTRAGTDEGQLTRAANYLGLKLASHVRRSPVTARRLIESKLRLGVPLILCAENWQHWVALLHKSRRGFLIFDSSRPGPVIQLWNWRKLERRLRLLPNVRRYRAHFRNNRSPIYAFMSLSRPIQRRLR
jgi:ABC-type bacteriocin/lantibiotic exporter with double-glycine peptidase domain